MSPSVRRARPSEAGAISELGIRSKSHWGYDREQMRIFAEELTLGPEDVAAKEVFVLQENDGSLLGYYALVAQTASNVELEHLFVDPPMLRRGHGSTLLTHARNQAKQSGFARMLVQSDPYAEDFYRAHGADVLMRLPTSIPGRTLPLMEIWLNEEPSRPPRPKEAEC